MTDNNLRRAQEAADLASHELNMAIDAYNRDPGEKYRYDAARKAYAAAVQTKKELQRQNRGR
jgi:hypothetical protein